MNLEYFRNYSSQYIKHLIDVRYTILSPEERQAKLINQFKQIINNIRHFTNTIEIDKYNSPMGFLFQHLKSDIIQLVANCSPERDKIFIEKAINTALITMNIEWNRRFFNALINLNAKDIIIWFFLQVPYYNESMQTIDKFRQTYEKIIDMIMILDINTKFEITEEEFIFISNETCMPYALAYHDRNNCAIMKKYCNLLRKICPWINYYSGRLAEKLFNNNRHTIKQITEQTTKQFNRRRICFISDSFHTDSSVLRDRVGIISKLDKNKYDVYFASFIPLTSQTISGIVSKIFFKNIALANQFIYLGSNNITPNATPSQLIITNARMILEKYEFDIIIYPDLGMKLLPTLLAYSRLAKMQITTWGHSDTSGIDTIDYYISSEWFESPLSQEHYSEKLVLFKSLGTYYISPHKLFIENGTSNTDTNTNTNIEGLKSRKEMGFDDNNSIHIYCCLQTFYKINEEFEHCMARILELDPAGVILLSNAYPYCQSHLARIKNTLGDEKISKLIWYPSLDKRTFLNLIAISDIVLDPFPFGGCNTSFEAFDYNVPVITYPSNYLHGRFTFGLYKKMGLGDCECIATSGEEYARLATNICLNEKLKHKISRNIEMQKYLIFQEKASVDEWNMFLNTI